METALSIIVPFFNMDRYLGQCLESLSNQSFSNIIILCIDDGSTDSSPTIAKDYCERDSRFHYYRKDNRGISSARNEGLKYVTTRYVAFVDADDWVEPDAYRIAMEHIHGSDLVVFGVNMVTEDGGSFYDRTHYFERSFEGEIQLTDDIRQSLDVVVWDKIFDMEVIRKHGISFPDGMVYEDNYFYWAYNPYIDRCYIIKDEVYNYRKHESSIMGTTKKRTDMALDYMRVASALRDYYVENDLIDSNKDNFDRILVNCFWNSLAFCTIIGRIKTVHMTFHEFRGTEVETDQLVRILCGRKFFQAFTIGFGYLFKKFVEVKRENR